MSISIHSIANLQKQTELAGTKPLACLDGKINGTLFFTRYDGSKWLSDVSSMPAKDIVYGLGGRTNVTLADAFPTYDWVTIRGFDDLSTRVESAAKVAGH